MFGRFSSRLSRFARLQRAFSTLQKQAQSNVVKSETLQFSKARLTDFGELPQGEIPTALQYDRATSK